MTPRIAILFIGTSAYLKYFERFTASVEAHFAPETERHFFVFSDNHLARLGEQVTFTKISFTNVRDVKLGKFYTLSQVSAKLADFDYVFYFDADSVVAETIGLGVIEGWFSGGRTLAGVLHPWRQIRSGDKRFEKNPASAAYVAPEEFGLLEYHQSCFWGARGPAAGPMIAAVREMIERDRAIGHVNEHLICDEIYVNRYFLTERARLCSLDTDFAHPGEEYERLTARDGRAGYRFTQRPMIVHDNAAQTKSWSRTAESSAFFTHGVFAQFYRCDLAAWSALKAYRTHNPQTPIHLVSDGGDDLAPLAKEFGCEYMHEARNNGTWRHRHADTSQWVWLGRVAAACATTLREVDWVVLLEPDVECQRTPVHFPRYALAGPGRCPAWSPALLARWAPRFGRLARTFGLGRNYTGCGGSIFRRETMAACFAQTKEADFNEAAALDERIRFAEDAALTWLFQEHGYDTGGWDDFAGWREEHRHACAFLHGNKQHYGQPLNTELAGHPGVKLMSPPR